MNKQTCISLVLAIALVISVAINIVLWIAWPNETASSPTDTPATVLKDMNAIKTPYGTVKFPSAFTDVRYEETEKDGVYSLAFFYVRGEESTEVFAIHFGDEQNGTHLGYVTKDNKQVPFTVTSAGASEDASWTPEEQEYFNSLMMAVNDVIASVQAWKTYSE